ncbi:MAG: PIG-L deacetylase family protein [Nitrospirota bacterium]
MKVLVVAAHPDDEIYGVGGTIVKHAKCGDEVYVCILTEGVTTQYANAMDKISLDNLIEQKKKESLKAAKILGIKEVFFFNLPDMRLDTIAHSEVNQPIEQCIVKLLPDIVYTHHWGDVNKDHRLAFESTMVAVRPGLNSPIKRVLIYETPSSSEWNAPILTNQFMPNVFVDISDVLPLKIQAMKAYKSELRPFPHPRSIEAVTTYAKKRGLEVGKKSVECFMLIREIM